MCRAGRARGAGGAREGAVGKAAAGMEQGKRGRYLEVCGVDVGDAHDEAGACGGGGGAGRMRRSVRRAAGAARATWRRNRCPEGEGKGTVRPPLPSSPRRRWREAMSHAVMRPRGFDAIVACAGRSSEQWL